jgi:hypothetical protein
VALAPSRYVEERGQSSGTCTGLHRGRMASPPER